MRPQNLHTKLFLDSGDPAETKEAIQLLGFLDGQTTNPSLVGKNPDVQQRIQNGNPFSSDEILLLYKKIVIEISNLIPDGSVSIEVYADHHTTSNEMITQATDMYTWIPNAHIKFPTNTAGLQAAEQWTNSGNRVNMTLCFTIEQSAAVYAATKNASKEFVLNNKFKQVFISPFVGRIDDVGQNGMQYVANTITLYKKGDGHVEVLAASIRTIGHFLQSLKLGADIITAPLSVYKQWVQMGMPIPDESYMYFATNVKDIPYVDLDLNADWKSFAIENPLLEQGITKFAEDWKKLVK